MWLTELGRFEIYCVQGHLEADRLLSIRPYDGGLPRWPLEVATILLFFLELRHRTGVEGIGGVHVPSQAS